jgi:hypothetical protein
LVYPKTFRINGHQVSQEISNRPSIKNAREAQDGLPTTLSTHNSSGGLGLKMVFERHRPSSSRPYLLLPIRFPAMTMRRNIARLYLACRECPLAADESSGGLGVRITFQRIVWPDGRKEVEGMTPKQLPTPSPVSVENNDQLICVEKPSENSASDDQ